jgi:hypothetical protein
MVMNAWLRHVFVLTMGLLIYYAVTFVVVYATIMSPDISSAIIADGGSPIGQVSTSIASLFPIPAILWLIGVILSKWIPF